MPYLYFPFDKGIAEDHLKKKLYIYYYILIQMLCTGLTYKEGVAKISVNCKP